MTAERKAWRKGLAGRLRTLVGRNEAEFARQIGIEPATFNTYTTGKTAPPVYVIWRVSQVTGCDLNVLVAGSAREAPAGGVQWSLGAAIPELTKTPQLAMLFVRGHDGPLFGSARAEGAEVVLVTPAGDHARYARTDVVGAFAVAAVSAT